MKKASRTLVLAMGTTLIGSLASVAVGAEAVDAQGSVFEMTELSSGYMQLAAADAAAKPAETKAKTMEGKCAGAKPMSAPKAAEGKCGEGQCGGAMKKAAEAAKPAIEQKKVEPAKSASDTASKATEGKCGEGKCGGAMKKAAEAAAKK